MKRSTGDNNPFDIHEDPRGAFLRRDQEGPRREASRSMAGDEEVEDNSVDSDDSESSFRSQVAVTQSVMEDMAKFEDTFQGITQRFRLINRIGEGKSS